MSEGAFRAAAPRIAQRLITMKLRAALANLRSRARCRVVLTALQKSRDRFGTRLVELSVQHDHIHIIAEARDAKALSCAM